MAELRYAGPSEITIDARDGLSVIAEPLTEGICTKIHLTTYRILDAEGITISPGDTRVTVYKEKDAKYLFILMGYRSEESIRILTEGPDEEKSEIVLERLCVLSLFGDGLS